MCDITDISNRKGMKVYRAPEFLYSHLGPSERWLKKCKNLFCIYVLKFNFAPITGSEMLYFL
jgi:hypothetical protein